MSTKLALPALDTYAQQYAARLCDDFFRNATVVRGDQLLTFSDVEQVNRFVVWDLYERWRSEAEAFRSPYFDFEHEDVRAALQTFMNTVSQHIAVRRDAFEPLLGRATRQTLHLLLAPTDFFEQFLRDRPGFALTPADTKLLQKYIRVHRFVPTGLAERLSGRDSMYVNEALEVLRELTTDIDRLDDPSPVIAQLKQQVPLDVDALYEPSVTPPAPGARSFFDLDEEETPRPAPAPIVPEPAPALVPEVAPAVSMPEPPYPTPRPASVLEQYQSQSQSTHRTLNDTMATDEAPATLADQFHRKATASIHSTISLNQKFIFINQLFGGDSMAYHQAITELENGPSFEEAKQRMNRTYAPQYQWRDSADVADEFFDIVRRRFGA
jgi:hypothetical protein